VRKAVFNAETLRRREGEKERRREGEKERRREGEKERRREGEKERRRGFLVSCFLTTDSRGRKGPAVGRPPLQLRHADRGRDSPAIVPRVSSVLGHDSPHR
jgi:hypothetical protein